MKTQSGRSMIEIIGVLAVMGVLSIAVLYLYPYLVAHHKSNETWNDVLVQATVVQTSHTDDTFAAIKIVDGEELPSLITSEEFETSAVGYPMEVYKTNDVQFIVQVDNVDYDACEIMLKKHSLVPDAIEVGNVKFEPIQENYDICGTSGTKTMYFYFGFCNGDINAVCDGGCGENFECFCGRCWCPIVGADAQTCQCPKNYEVIKGECVCPTGDLTTEDVCCPKGEHADGEICCEDGQYNSKGICCEDGDYNSNGVCCPADLFDDGETNRWIEQNGECVCNQEYLNCQNGLVPNADCTACVCPTGDLTTDGKCCPVGRHADGELCCLEGDYNSYGVCCPTDEIYATVSKKCCPKERYNSYYDRCCLPGETYASKSWSCCPDERYNSSKKTCCLEDQHASFGVCCPTGQEYYSDLNACCAEENYNPEDGICCQYGYDAVNKVCKCPDGWSEGIHKGYCFKNLGRKTASGAATACKNAGGFLPTLWQAKNYLGGNRSLLVSDQRGNRCGKNLVTYYWIANIGNVKNTHTNLSCTNANGYAFVASNGEECHPETKAPTFCLRKR